VAPYIASESDGLRNTDGWAWPSAACRWLLFKRGEARLWGLPDSWAWPGWLGQLWLQIFFYSRRALIKRQQKSSDWIAQRELFILGIACFFVFLDV